MKRSENHSPAVSSQVYNKQAIASTCPATQCRAGRESLTCLYSHISNEKSLNSPISLPLTRSGTGRFGGYEERKARFERLADLVSRTNELSTNHKKTAHILYESVAQMVSHYGIENLGFLTLTFAEHVTDPKEAQRRLNSFLTGVINDRYQDYLGVLERQKSGRIHYHLLIVLNHDIRSGYDFTKGNRKKSASSYLKHEWEFLRKKTEQYGFGRSELEPIKSTEQAISRYVGKYISKHIGARDFQDRGVRLVRYSKKCRAGTSHFSFYTENSKKWRKNVSLFAAIVSEKENVDIENLADLTAVLGRNWAYHFRKMILTLSD